MGNHSRTASMLGFPLMVLIAIPLAGFASSSSAQEQAEEPAPAVTVVEVTTRDVAPTFTVTGRVQAVDSVDVVARIEGFLAERHFKEGETVAAGDLLFSIQKEAYEAAVDEARGALEAATGDLTLAQLERDRQATLVERQAVAQAALDEAEASLAKAKGALLRAQGRLTEAELDLSYTEISAPFAGRIGASAYSEGAYVGPESSTLATLVSQDPIYVTFPAAMSQFLRFQRQVQAGERTTGEGRATLELADGTTYEQPGRYDFTDIQVDPGTDTVEIRLVFDNPDGLLVDQALVDVSIATEAPKPTLVVPQVAIQFDQVGRYVLALDADDRVEIRRVTVGDPLGVLTTVAEGLAAGDRVITEGVQKVRPGGVVDPEVAPMPEPVETVEG